MRGTWSSTNETISSPLSSACTANKSALSSTVVAHVEVDALELELAGLDLGEVENIVDDGQQRVGAIADGLGEFPLLGAQRRVEQKVASCR